MSARTVRRASLGRALWWAVVVAVLVAPALHLPSYDSFPLSAYPMFSRPLATEVDIEHVVAELADGTIRVLPPKALGTDEVLTARAVARHAASDPEAARSLCTSVAARVRDDDDITAIVVRVDRYDAVRYFAERKEPIATREVARCPV